MTNVSVYALGQGSLWASGVSSASFIADWQTQLNNNFGGSLVALAGVVGNVLTGTVQDFTGESGDPYVYTDYSFAFGDWVIGGAKVTATQFALKYATAANVGAALNLQQEVAAASIPALLLGGSTSVTATFKNAFPSTAFMPKWRAFAGVSVLSTITAVESSRTASSITYTVSAPGVATAAGILLVDAYVIGN